MDEVRDLYEERLNKFKNFIVDQVDAYLKDCLSKAEKENDFQFAQRLEFLKKYSPEIVDHAVGGFDAKAHEEILSAVKEENRLLKEEVGACNKSCYYVDVSNWLKEKAEPFINNLKFEISKEKTSSPKGNANFDHWYNSQFVNCESADGVFSNGILEFTLNHVPLKGTLLGNLYIDDLKVCDFCHSDNVNSIYSLNDRKLLGYINGDKVKIAARPDLFGHDNETYENSRIVVNYEYKTE